MRKLSLLFALVLFVMFSHAQNIMNNPTSNHGNKFEQLGTILPTPNEYRTASGAPGNKYWQQREWKKVPGNFLDSVGMSLEEAQELYNTLEGLLN